MLEKLLDRAAVWRYPLIKQLLNRCVVISMAPEELNNSIGGNRDLCDAFCLSGDVEALREKALEVTGLSEVFKVLGDETRTKILYLLAQRELCTCDLAAILDMTLPAISHHLRLLKVFRLVKYRREGKLVYYSLGDDHILHLIREAQEHFAEDR